MRLEESILLKSFQGTQSQRKYYKDLVAFSTATSPPSFNHRLSSFDDGSRYVLNSTSSSPESMSVSSPERRQSSEDSDSEADCNSLLMERDTYTDNASRRHDVSYGNQERYRSQSLGDSQWNVFHPINGWSSATAQADYPIDHGYHSMEPLDYVASTKYPQTYCYSNANVRTVMVNDKYRHCVQPQEKGLINNRVKKLSPLPTNNNQTTDSLWHDSAWSAPQKSRSFNSCVNPFEEFLEVNKRIKSSSRIKETYEDGFRQTSGEWYKPECNTALDYTYIKGKVDDDPAIDSAWTAYGNHHQQSDRYRTFADESRITLDHLNKTLKEDDAIWKSLKIEYQPETDKWFKSDTEQLQNIEHVVESNIESLDDKLSPSSNSSPNESASSPLATIPKVSMMSCINNGEQQSKLLQYDSAVSLNSSGDVDVNMVSRTFNNFTISSNKQRDILKLLQEKRKILEANICENQPRNEMKILNTGRSIVRTGTGLRRRRICRKSFVTRNGTSPDIADGLVLEKIRYDPNWRRHNSALCSADDTVKQFKVPVSNPLSVPSQKTKFEEHVTDVQISPPTPPNLPASNSDPIPEGIKESPIENTTPSMTIVKSDVEQSEQQQNCSDNSKDSNGKRITNAVSKLFGDFDVYDIESTMPTIDWAAMEANLIRAAEEDNWSARRRNDREEIRRRLALGPDADEFYYCNGVQLTKKPSLTTRLQSGMNLQICFMNETASDSDGANSDHEGQSICSSTEDSTSETKSLLSRTTSPNNNSMRSLSNFDSDRTSPNSTTDSSQCSQTFVKRQRPSFFFAKQKSWRLRSRHKHETVKDESEKKAVKEVEDFFTRQARLQAEARLALSQAKEMAKMQMQIERQKCKKSPISDIVGLTFPENGRYSVSHQILSTMNIAQLQVIVNDLHTQIEKLNEDLVSLLLKRDDLHMEQDSMLVDIEDLTRYLGAKETGAPPPQKELSLK